MKTALIAGSTGLIGKHLLQLLLESAEYNFVKAITRKPLDFQHPKLENIIVDFDKLTEQYSHFKADDVYCFCMEFFCCCEFFLFQDNLSQEALL